MLDHLSNCHGEWNALLAAIGSLPFVGLWLRFQLQRLQARTMMYITEGTPSYMLDPVKIGWSKIDGQGIITTAYVNAGDLIFKGVDKGTSSITYLGSFVNHQKDATAKLEKVGEDYWVVALINLYPGMEVTVDYTQLPPFLNRNTAGFQELDALTP